MGLQVEDEPLGELTTEVPLRFLRACREAKVPGTPGTPGPNVVRLSGRRADQYAAATINRRLAATSGLFAFAAVRDPSLTNPVPKDREARWRVAGERTGMLAHTARRPKNRSSLRLREPRRLPVALSQSEAAELLGSFRTWRDQVSAGLMLYCGLRSAEVLGLEVCDVDIGGRWLKVSPAEQLGTTYLLVGSDSRAGSSADERKKLGTGNAAGRRTDTVLLLHVGRGPNLLLSLPRDSLVPGPQVTAPRRSTRRRVRRTEAAGQDHRAEHRLRVDHFVEIGFGGFVNSVDAVGGIRVGTNKRLDDPLANLHMKKGCHNVNGVKALAFSRS